MTEGRFVATEVTALEGMPMDEVPAWAAAPESQSERPIAGGVVRWPKERGLALKPVRDCRSLPGEGPETSLEGRDAKVVGPGYLRRGNLEVGSADVERVVEQGKTDVYAVIDDEVVSAIALAAIVRLEFAALTAEQFPPDSIGPKVEGATTFAAATDHSAAIGHLEDAVAILRCDAGVKSG